jgi:hypothetical protein
MLTKDRSQRLRLRDLKGEASSAQIAAPFFAGLRIWMCFNPRAAMKKADGLFPVTDNPVMPKWVGRRMFDLLITARTENDTFSHEIESSPGVAVFVSQAESPLSWIAIGRARRRFLIAARIWG